MSGSSSTISPFSLEPPPKPKRSERRGSLSPPRRSRAREGGIFQAGLPDSHVEPDLPLARMEIDLPKIYWDILYANVLGNILIWALLCAFLVLPATFSSFSFSHALNGLGGAGKLALNTIQNIPFLWFAGSCSFCVLAGSALRWRQEIRVYIWSTNPLFL